MNFNHWTPEQRKQTALTLLRLTDEITNAKNIKWLPKVLTLGVLKALYQRTLQAISEQNDFNFPNKENNQ